MRLLRYACRAVTDYAISFVPGIKQLSPWLRLAKQISFDAHEPDDLSPEDLIIFGQTVAYALEDITPLSSDRTAEFLCEKAASTLQYATRRSYQWRTAAIFIHELLCSALIGSPDERSPTRCTTLLEKSPVPFHRLLRVLEEDASRVGGQSSSHLFAVLVTAHSRASPPIRQREHIRPGLNDRAYWDEKGTAVIAQYPFGLSAHTRQQTHLFIWAAHHWITRTVALPTSLWEGGEPSKALMRMTNWLRLANTHGLENCGFDNAIFPWAGSLLLSGDVDLELEESPIVIPIVVLQTHVPDALSELLQALKSAVDDRRFVSRWVEYDLKLACSCIEAGVSPEKMEQIVVWRAGLAQDNRMASKCFRCSYYLS